MKFSQVILVSSGVAAASARPFKNLRRQDGSFDGLSFAQIDALTPQFGHAADVNPDGTGNCDGAVNGANGQPIQVPCDCPPDRTTFIQVSILSATHAFGSFSLRWESPRALPIFSGFTCCVYTSDQILTHVLSQDLINNLNAGKVINNPSVPISFPTDDSTASIEARFNAATVTLQNLNGSGVGCPQSSTTWTAQLQAILAGASSSADTAPATTAAADTTPAATTTSAAAATTSLSLEEIDELAPQLGFQAGVNPDGTGNCDGAVDGANGQPIQVPCDCPPDRATFIQVRLLLAF